VCAIGPIDMLSFKTFIRSGSCDLYLQYNSYVKVLWHAQFSECSVLCEASCLHCLLSVKRDLSLTDHLHRTKTFKLPPART